MESADLTTINIDKVAEIFPNCITEKETTDGKIKRAIDFDVLRQILSDDLIEEDEAYKFTWVGKKASIAAANKRVRKTLRPCKDKSVDWDITENIYIEGDNLDALKLLQESYLEKVKVIYIDPPYNTGADFIYSDNYRVNENEYEEALGVFSEQGEKLFKNTDSNGRFHSDWCSMIYPRLVLARNLLAPDGVIFISIDNNEYAALKLICDEIFGRQNFVSNVIWQKNYAPHNNVVGIPSMTEYVLVYSKLPSWEPNLLPRTESMDKMYKNPDNDFSAWKSGDPCAPGAVTHQGMVYAIQQPITGEMLYPSNGNCWRMEQAKLLDVMNEWAPYELRELDDREKRAQVCNISSDKVREHVKGIVLSCSIEEAQKLAQKRYDEGKWPIFYFTKEGRGGLARKRYLEGAKGKAATSLWLHEEVGHTDEAKKEIKGLFDGLAPFDTPKPTRLLERIIDIASDKDAIIMDFFSGSATTAHAVMKKNAEDGGKRKYILVQLDEEIDNPNYSNLCEVGEERIKRAAEEYKSKNIDCGVRIFKIDDSNMNNVYYNPAEYNQNMIVMLEDNIKQDRSDLDLFFGCILDWGLPLSLPYISEDILGCKVHTYNDGDLIACFEEKVPDEVIKEIAKRRPFRAVFRDASFENSASKINVGENFKLLAPDTIVKVI